YAAADRSAWPAFREEVDRTHRDMWTDFDAFCRSAGAPALAWGELGPDFIHEPPWLNLYVYPSIADYSRANALGPTWHRLDSCVRSTTDTWTLPDHLAAAAPDSGLVYLSLGSLGS